MKKNVVYGLLVMFALFSFSLNSYAENKSHSLTSTFLKTLKATYAKVESTNDTTQIQLANSASLTIPDDARQIKVYLIVGANGAGVPKDAKYSSSTNRIYIKEGKNIMDYNVYENRHYGQERDPKGAYKYTAGNYYFDL